MPIIQQQLLYACIIMLGAGVALSDSESSLRLKCPEDSRWSLEPSADSKEFDESDDSDSGFQLKPLYQVDLDRAIRDLSPDFQPQVAELVQPQEQQVKPTESAGCHCKKCPARPLCAPGEVLLELSEGNGRPGTCCSQFKCGPEPKCEGTAVNYWMGACTKCNSCRRPCTSVCNPQDQASNCLTDKGQVMLNGASWLQGNACVNCTCVGGNSLCREFYCKPAECANPVKKPDECCPSCPEQVDMPPEVQPNESLDNLSSVTATRTTTAATPLVVGHISSESIGEISHENALSLPEVHLDQAGGDLDNSVASSTTISSSFGTSESPEVTNVTSSTELPEMVDGAERSIETTVEVEEMETGSTKEDTTEDTKVVTTETTQKKEEVVEELGEKVVEEGVKEMKEAVEKEVQKEVENDVKKEVEQDVEKEVEIEVKEETMIPDMPSSTSAAVTSLSPIDETPELEDPSPIETPLVPETLGNNEDSTTNYLDVDESSSTSSSSYSSSSSVSMSTEPPLESTTSGPAALTPESTSWHRDVDVPDRDYRLANASTNDPSNPSLWYLVGIIAMAITAVLLTLLICVLCWRRRKSMYSSVPHSDSNLSENTHISEVVVCIDPLDDHSLPQKSLKEFVE